MSDDHLIIVAARALYANFTLSMVVTGIHVFMTVYGFSVFLETPESQRKGRKGYIAASIVITALQTCSASLDMAHYFQMLFQSTSPRHWGRLMNTTFFKDWKYLVSSTLGFGLVTMIGDALLVYRCYIVCTEYWWVTILPMLTSLSALVVLCLGVYIGNADTSTKYSSASSLLTVTTNIAVTSFITFRLLRARRTMAKLLPSADARLYTGVITILIESAAPVTVFGIVAAILQQLNNALFNSSPGFLVCRYLFDGLYYSFCGLSPHMIIFRVTTGRSFTRFPASRDGGPSNPIQFAPQTAKSSFLQSTWNQELGQSFHQDIEQGLQASVNEPTQTHIGPVGGNHGEDLRKAE